MKIRVPKLPFRNILILIAIFALGLSIGYSYVVRFQARPQVAVEKNTPKAFISEVYDKIKENYWNNISDGELLDFFKIAISQNGGSIDSAKLENKDRLLQVLNSATSGMDEEKRNKFYITVAAMVLNSLGPQGRSGLFTQKQEEALKNTVSNINPEKDLYKDLGLEKGASEAAVQQAYQKLAVGADSQKLKQLTYAKDTLTQKDTKQRYDTNQVEPTIFSEIPSPGILYVQFKKFSPTSLEEFQKAFEGYKDDPKLQALILDLRGNVGGAIDATSYFMGFFLGKNQYAFDFYHKGEYLPFKTQTDKLLSAARFKQVVVLVDNQTQSSAEMMAASLKKYHIGVIMGVPTKGWGTVERVFPLDNQISQKEKYSMFLVHSITLRNDNLPIEGRGVEPDISINDPNWPQKLLQYFNNTDLTSTVKEIISTN